MDPTHLIGPSSPLGYPAPYWFLACGKVVGFTLHMAPMHLWSAGVMLAMLLRWRGGAPGGVLSRRLMKPMPVIVAYGVNFGIIPLLFTQVAYYRIFYPATILIAWPWFSIVLMLMCAYYGVYAYAIGLREGGARLMRLRSVAGWAAAILFVAIGFVFANGFSLMTNVGAWPHLWLTTSVAGAPTGTALNTGDPTLWPRWLMMLGLALTTTAAYVAVDASLFASAEGDHYTRWARRFALRLYTLGLAWFAVTGAWYVFGTWSTGVRQHMFGGPLVALTVLTAVAPGLPWLLLVAHMRQASRGLALAIGLAQLGVLALNATSRQVVQNLELSPFLDVTAEPVKMQWSPLLLFLLSLVAGVAVIAWMVAQVVAAHRRPATE